MNSRLDELQSAFLNVKLNDLDKQNIRRREIAKKYVDQITNPKIKLPNFSEDSHVFHLFVIRTENRDKLKQYLWENGIDTMIHYPIPPHKQKALSHWNDLSFPITEKIHREVLSLPISPVMSYDEVNEVIRLINNY